MCTYVTSGCVFCIQMYMLHQAVCCVLQVRAEEFSHTTFHGKAAPPIYAPPLASPPISALPLAAPPKAVPLAPGTPLAVVGKPIEPVLPVKPVQPAKQGGRLTSVCDMDKNFSNFSI